MRHYEAVIIYDTAVDPQEIQVSLDKTLATISAFEGTPGSVDRWGRRTFAYEVNHKREGYYIIASFAGEPATVAELDRSLGIADEVVRHKIIRLPDNVVAARAASV